jgi:hypothetical protein
VGAPAATGQRAVLRAALQYAEFDLPVFPVYLAAGRQTVARFLGTNGGNRKTGRTHQ